MLQLKKHRFNHSFSIFQPIRALVLSPALDEDDELIKAIEADKEETWQLENAPDATGLDRFWNGVEHDLVNDPDWVNFAAEDE